MDTPTFRKCDPAQADFWNQRFEAGFTPWDQGGVPVELSAWVETNPAQKGQRVLIPGCGNAWEVAFLRAARWEVDAIDFSPQAVAQARARLGADADAVREDDFFGTHLASQRFDLVYERAFLCALPRKLWSAWAQRVSELLPTDGKLLGYFYRDENPRGPPFGLMPGELESLLSPHFVRIESTPCTDSVAAFQHKEQWEVWLRK